MDLGLAMAAGNAYFEQGKRNEQYEYDKARRDADRSTLQDQTNANRSGYQLRSAQNNAELGLLPQRAEVAGNELALKGGQVKGDLGRQPMTEQTKDLNVQTERDKALVNSALEQVDVADLPRAIMLKKQAGILKEAEASGAAVAGLAKYFTANDTAGAAKFLNDMNATSPEGKGFVGQVASVGTVPSNPSDPNSPRVLIAVDANNQPIKRQDGTILQIPTHLMTGPVKYEKLDAGETMVKTDGLGNVSPVYTAPENKSLSIQDRRPREIQLSEYYKSTHPNATQDEADNWAKTRSSGSRQDFVAKEYGNTLMIAQGATPEEKAANAVRMVNAAADVIYGKKSDGPGLHNTSPTQAAPNQKWKAWQK